MAQLIFTLAGVSIEFEYRAVKSIKMTVYPPDGRVRIAAPPGTSLAEIKNFAAARIAWIVKHRERFQNNSKSQGSLRNHSTVYVWGEPYELELVEHRGNSRIKIDGGLMKMYIRPLSPKAKKLEILDRWYRRILKEAAQPVIDKWAEILDIEVNKLYIRKMKSHWGSCNCQKQTLRLNSELAKRSPECLEYVVVHEMLHIIERGHNQNYYRLLNRYIPQWKVIRKKMNSGEF